MSDKRSNHYFDNIQRVFDYINQNLDEEFLLSDLSEIANFSKFHFSRQFSAYAGISVFRYIQLMRLKRASYQLAFTETKIIDISLDAQFENHESFTRAFKQLFNQTPSQFRKKPDWPSWQKKFLKATAIPNQQELLAMEINLVNFETRQVAILEHRGSPNLVLESVAKFIEWRKQSGLSPVKTSQSYGVAYDDPSTTEEQKFRFDICGSINTNIPNNPQGVKTGLIPGGRCAVLRHLGSHDDMDDKIRYLYSQWLPESGESLRDFPCFFHYLNLIPEVEEHQLITDIYLPLQ